MSTQTYNQFQSLKPKSRIKQSSGQKMTNKHVQKYTGTKSHLELRNAMCINSVVHPDIFNK